MKPVPVAGPQHFLVCTAAKERYPVAMVVKKYSNRRMYDTKRSTYVRLEELADRIRAGENIQVVDAETGQDLTRSVLVQLLIESRGGARLLPDAVLLRLLRLDDASLAEFLGGWVGWSLDSYVRSRQTAQPAPVPVAQPAPAFAPYPAPVPMPQPQAIPPVAAGTPPPGEWGADDSEVASGVRAKEGSATKDDVAALRRELDELKDLIRGRATKRKSG